MERTDATAPVCLTRDVRSVLDGLRQESTDRASIADRLGRSPESVDAAVETLRAAGFEIGVDGDQLRLLQCPGYPAGVACGLAAPYALELHDVIGSTNERASELGRAGALDVAVLASEQTAGRGRRDRDWHSPTGGIWCSVLVRPDLPSDRTALLTLAGAVAVAAALMEIDVPAKIKWPNDVLVGPDERKIAGVLTKVGRSGDGTRWAAVGIGVNADVSPDVLPPKAGSLRDLVSTVDRSALTRRTLETFEEIRRSPTEIRDRWRTVAATTGRRVRVDTPDGPLVGRAEDITETGALRIQTDQGSVDVTVGDCEHLRPA